MALSEKKASELDRSIETIQFEQWGEKKIKKYMHRTLGSYRTIKK